MTSRWAGDNCVRDLRRISVFCRFCSVTSALLPRSSMAAACSSFSSSADRHRSADSALLRAIARSQVVTWDRPWNLPACEEAVMRTIPFVLITFVVLSLSPTAARAGANGSWCANYGTGLDGAINCSYTSFEQCRATVSGIYGFCTPNPYPGTGYGRGGTYNLTPTSRGRSYRTER